MKPCSSNRMSLALLALGELDAPRAAALRTHIQTCEGCRGYLAEMSTITERQALAERFVAGWSNWRVALPVVGAAALMIVMLSIPVRHPTAPTTAPTSVQAVLPPDIKSDLPPTIANYQRIATRSLDELDDLLTMQGRRNPSPTPIYTASLFAPARALD